MTKERKRKENPNKPLTAKPRFSEAFVILAAAFILLLLLKNPRLVQESVISSLKKCALLLIPSLFPLMVASEIAMECGAVEKITRPLNGALSKILGIKKEAAPPFFLGLLGGYTTSSVGALSLYTSGKISKRDCERLIALSSLPSLSFLTGFVGVGIFESTTVGWILWLISIASSLILGILTQKTGRKKEKTEGFGNRRIYKAAEPPSASFSKIVVGAISHSASAMLIICACVVFFSALIDTLNYPLAELGMNENIRLVLLGALELTGGISSCTDIDVFTFKICLSAFFIGWSGLCVHFQIISLCESSDLSFKKYFLYKLFQGLICAALALVLFS